MYFFEKQYEYFSGPWPHIIINDALDLDLSNKLSEQFIESQSPDTRTDLWNEFISYNESRLEDMVKLLDSVFNHSTGPYQYQTNLCGNLPNNGKVEKDWHIDGPDKIYQILYYMDSEENTGYFEAANDANGTNSKIIPYQHNRILAFKSSHGQDNEKQTWHRFFSTVKSHRKTFNIPIQTIDI
jgi:hypothetical protein